jgi:hypothetical protein
MNLRTSLLSSWVRIVMAERGVSPERGEVRNFAQNLRKLELQQEAAADPREAALIAHDGWTYAGHIGRTAPHLDMDVPCLLAPDTALTRAQHQALTELEAS